MRNIRNIPATLAAGVVFAAGCGEPPQDKALAEILDQGCEPAVDIATTGNLRFLESSESVIPYTYVVMQSDGNPTVRTGIAETRETQFLLRDGDHSTHVRFSESAPYIQATFSALGKEKSFNGPVKVEGTYERDAGGPCIIKTSKIRVIGE